MKNNINHEQIDKIFQSTNKEIAQLYFKLFDKIINDVEINKANFFIISIMASQFVAHTHSIITNIYDDDVFSNVVADFISLIYEYRNQTLAINELDIPNQTIN